MTKFLDKLFKTIFACGAIAYLFLFTFYPVLHNHSYFSLNHDYCDSHDEHEHNSSENNNTDNPNCPACEFLVKAALGIVADMQISLGFDPESVSTAIFAYHQPYRKNFYYFFLGRAPPPQFIAV